MQIKYCLPIIRNKKNEVLEVIHANITDYSYFEVWLDYIDDFDEKFVIDLNKLLGKRLILLFRRQHLEEIHMGLERRLKIISLIKKSQVLLDLDIFKQREELDYIKANRIKVDTIISYHNYQETPGHEKLGEIINNMSKYKSAILKIATMCNSQKDALELLQLLTSLKKKSLKCIVLGMGEFGNVTRIFGTLWGNEMVFAPIKTSEQTALGQLTRNQLEIFFKELRG